MHAHLSCTYVSVITKRIKLIKTSSVLVLAILYQLFQCLFVFLVLILLGGLRHFEPRHMNIRFRGFWAGRITVKYLHFALVSMETGIF